jgi:hypothetical protein
VVTKVEVEPATLAKLHRLPVSSIKKVLGWTADVNDLGIAAVQKLPAYQDKNVPGKPGRRTARVTLEHSVVYSVRGGVVWIEDINENENN